MLIRSAKDCRSCRIPKTRLSSSMSRGKTSFLPRKRSTQRSISLSSRPMMTSIIRALASAMATTIKIYTIAHKGSMVITSMVPQSTIIHTMPRTSTVIPTILTKTILRRYLQWLHILTITRHLTIFSAITNTILEEHTHHIITLTSRTTHQLFRLTSIATMATTKAFHIHLIHHSGITRTIISNRCLWPTEEEWPFMDPFLKCLKLVPHTPPTIPI